MQHNVDNYETMKYETTCAAFSSLCLVCHLIMALCIIASKAATEWSEMCVVLKESNFLFSFDKWHRIYCEFWCFNDFFSCLWPPRHCVSDVKCFWLKNILKSKRKSLKVKMRHKNKKQCGLPEGWRFLR